MKRVAVPLVILLALVLALVAYRRCGRDTTTPEAASGSAAPVATHTGSSAPPALRPPQPGQNRARVATADAAGGTVGGRVVDWSTGEGVANAELTFVQLGAAGGATTVRTGEAGSFELAPPAPGRFTLFAIAATGYLPYAPEYSGIVVDTTAHRAVKDLTVFIFRALDYHGRVVDAKQQPVAGAKIRLLGTPANEQAIDKLETEWTADKDGKFTFHAADDAVFEAVMGARRGWATLDGDVQITHEMTIVIGDAPARTSVIEGKVVDGSGAPVADVLVDAQPADVTATNAKDARAPAFATTGPDGKFTLRELDAGRYDLEATPIESSAPARSHVRTRGLAAVGRKGVPSGTRDVVLVIEPGLPLAGRVVAGKEPVAAFTLLVFKKTGAERELVIGQSFVDADGAFDVRVAAGEYELIATAGGRAPNEPVSATAGTTGIELAMSEGAVLRGVVVAADGSGPLQYARVMRETRGGGASVSPANAGTVTRDDGTFELTGIPPGAFSIRVGAGEFHPKIEGGLVASEGATLGPVTIALTRLKPGERPSLELVGIGCALAADGDALRVDRVFDGSGAAAAGIVAGDHVTAVDGAAVDKLGLEGAIAKIRGVEGTTVAITLRRPSGPVTLVVERRKLRA